LKEKKLSWLGLYNIVIARLEGPKQSHKIIAFQKKDEIAAVAALLAMTFYLYEIASLRSQ